MYAVDAMVFILWIAVLLLVDLLTVCIVIHSSQVNYAHLSL